MAPTRNNMEYALFRMCVIKNVACVYSSSCSTSFKVTVVKMNNPDLHQKVYYESLKLHDYFSSASDKLPTSYEGKDNF